MRRHTIIFPHGTRVVFDSFNNARSVTIDDPDENVVIETEQLDKYVQVEFLDPKPGEYYTEARQIKRQWYTYRVQPHMSIEVGDIVLVSSQCASPARAIVRAHGSGIGDAKTAYVLNRILRRGPN